MATVDPADMGEAPRPGPTVSSADAVSKSDDAHDSSEYEDKPGDSRLTRMRKGAWSKPVAEIRAKASDAWKEISTPKPYNRAFLPSAGTLEVMAKGASGMASSIAGGYAGAVHGVGNYLLTGDSFDQSMSKGADTTRAVQEAGTYQPRLASGKLIDQLLSTPMEMLSSVSKQAFGAAGDLVGPKTGLAMESAGEIVPAVVGTLLGGRAAMNSVGTPAGLPKTIGAGATATTNNALRQTPRPVASGEALPTVVPPLPGVTARGPQPVPGATRTPGWTAAAEDPAQRAAIMAGVSRAAEQPAVMRSNRPTPSEVPPVSPVDAPPVVAAAATVPVTPNQAILGPVAAVAVSDAVPTASRKQGSGAASAGAGALSRSEEAFNRVVNLDAPPALPAQLAQDPVKLAKIHELSKQEGYQNIRDFLSNQAAWVGDWGYAMADALGPTAMLDKYSFGANWNQGMRIAMARDYNVVKGAFKKADDSPEGRTVPVPTNEISDFFKHLKSEGLYTESPVIASLENLLNAQIKASKLKDPKVKLAGSLEDATAQIMNPVESTNPVSAFQSQTMRRAVNRILRHADDDSTVYWAMQFKNKLDAAQRQAFDGGRAPLYAEADTLRRDFGKKFEDNKLLAQVLKTTKSGEPAVPFERTFDRLFLNGNRDSVVHVMKVMNDADPALVTNTRAMILQELSDSMTQGGSLIPGTNQRAPSLAKLDRYVQKLEEGGKLDVIMGKGMAEAMRDFQKYARDTVGTPAGTPINRSNTANAIQEMLKKAAIPHGYTGSLVKHFLSSFEKVAQQREADAILRTARPNVIDQASTPSAAP